MKIVFFKYGAFSNINSSVESLLLENFPNMRLEVADVKEFVAKDILGLKNLFYLSLEYGWDFLTFKKSRYEIRTWAFCTSYLFKLIKKRINEKYRNEKGDILFTFQTQSLFDASIQGIKHFVYTDSTVLANYQYPYSAPRKFLKSKQWMKMEPLVYQNANLNFVFSQNQYNSIVKDYGINPEKVKSVFAGSNSKVNHQKEYGSNYEKKNILFVGVNWERKGGPLLYKAFQELDENVTLTIVGCKPKISHPRVRILGRVSLEEVDMEYENASIFCMPTKQEPFGIVFVEAMLRKLPVVSHRIGALPDMVVDGENGFLVEPFDHQGLVAVLKKLTRDPELCKAMGQKGFELAAMNYTWEKVGEKIKKSIQEAI